MWGQKFFFGNILSSDSISELGVGAVVEKIAGPESWGEVVLTIWAGRGRLKNGEKILFELVREVWR